MQAPSIAEAQSAASAPRAEFSTLYEAHFDFVWRTLRRLGVEGSRLDDGLQEVFIVVHRRLAEFDGGAPRAWLAAIARRVASDYRRDQRRRLTARDPGALEAALAVTASDVPTPASRVDASRLLYDLLDGLDTERREVFVLAELEGLGMPEVAHVLEININTAYSRLRAARRGMQAALARHLARENWRAT